MVRIMKTAPNGGAESYGNFDSHKGPMWVMEKDATREIIYSNKGVGANKENGGTPTMTIGQLVKLAAEKKGNKPALRAESPVPAMEGKSAPPSAPRAQWKTWTYKQYYNDATRVAKALMSLGAEQHDAVNIFGFNSPEWHLSKLGSMIGGFKAAGVYPTDTEDQLQFKSFHSGASVATCEGEKELNKFRAIAERLPHLKAVVVWAFDDVSDIKRADGSVVRVLTWADFMKEGDKVDDALFQERTSKILPEHCATLIYTSGTTGNPKAVMLSHDALVFEANVVVKHLSFIGDKAAEERCISYLPLSHVAGMMVDIIFPVVLSAFRPGWMVVHFARPYDLKAGTLGDRLKAIQPTVFIGVPRVWEKISEKMKAVGAKTKGIKKKLATWAKAKGLAHQENCQLGGSGAKPKFYGMANKIVLSKVKTALGLDECKFGFTGAAPITKETQQYFGALGINVNEVYGMSECSGACTWSLDAAHTWGSIGFPMAGVEFKVFKVDPSDINKKTECPYAKDIEQAKEAEQGELCFRGRNTMMGYLANPLLGQAHVDEIAKKNAGAIDSEGWIHSGDMGCMNKQMMIKITGRYKELIITAGGENVAPVPIEDSVKKLCPAISNIMMIGDKRKFNVALITLKAVGATGELPGSDMLDGAAADVNPSVKTITAAMEDAKMIKAITDAITATNNDGSVVPSNAAKIQKFTILPSDFSVQTEELTATLKLKRGVVMKKHHETVEDLYKSKEVYVKYA